MLSRPTKRLLESAYRECTKNNKSLEFTIQYMKDCHLVHYGKELKHSDIILFLKNYHTQRI